MPIRLPLIHIGILLFLVFASGLLLPLPAQTPAFPWPEGKKAALSLTFDDARLSHPDVGQALFKKLNARVTFYVVPSGMQNRLEGWKKIVADGHEIGNHTVYHPCTGNFPWSRDKALENYTLATMRQELLAANQEVQAMLGVTPVSFAYTCGNTFVGRGANTQSYVPLVSELFETGRGWLNEAANDPAFVDMALVQGVEMDGKDFERDIKPLVDAAVASGAWLVLAGHEIGEGGNQTTRVKMLEQLVAYVQRPESGIWLAPVGPVAAYVNAQREQQAAELAEALTFCSTFDAGFDADFALGDARIFGAPDYAHPDQATAGLVPEEVAIAAGRGRFGHALEFKRKGQPILFYSSEKNMIYRESNWSGTLSLWLSLDPETDLAPGYSDPIQITDAGYNDAALWVDFSDKNPRSFRMGVYGDLAVWNPEKADDNPAFDLRLLTATDRPFSRGRWTHIAVTFSRLNSEGKGHAEFYVNGKSQGSREITEPFTWELKKSRIFLGLNYIGLMDEVALFDRALSAQEVKSLYELTEGIGMLLDKRK
jgi:peptidoglycan-N-acetylglucosamine deacetylase